jgi:hypothetical protein
MANIKYLPVGGIVTEGMQIRVKMDPDVVLDYAEAMKGGKKFPPLLTFFDGEKYFLADGFHRLYAARELTIAKIECEVRNGTRLEARLAACGANQGHGLRRDNPDKRRAVQVALELQPDWSSRLIAEHVGVGHTIVDVVRRQLASDASSNVRKPRQSDGFSPPPTPPQRLGRDGKIRELPPVPVRSKAPEVGDQRVVGRDQRAVGSGEQAVERGTEGTEGTEGTQGNDEHGLVDSLGRHVPEDLAPLWHRRQEVQDVLTQLSRMRTMLRHAQESQDPLWVEANFSSVLAHLDQAYSAVDATKPYVVCPMCQGIGCRACKERGLLGKFRYDTVIPRELKVKATRREGAQ